MRSVLAIAALALMFGASAQAEKRVFIIANASDGYGVDRCLASGETCGAAAATALCKARAYAHAVSYRKVERDEITGAIPVGGEVCSAGICEAFLAIECKR